MFLSLIYIPSGQHSSFMGNLKIPEKASLWFKVIPSERNSKPIYVCQKNNQENLLSVQSRIGRFCRPYQRG